MLFKLLRLYIPPLTIIYHRHPPATRYEHIKTKLNSTPETRLTSFQSCWGCCQPIENARVPANETTVCTEVCRPEKPECPTGEAPTGSEGCWGCCEAIPTPRPCTLECKLEKPECPAGEAPTGGEVCDTKPYSFFFRFKP